MATPGLAKKKGLLSRELFDAVQLMMAPDIPLKGNLWGIGDTVSVLLRYHANPSVLDSRGRTPLIICVSEIAAHPYNLMPYFLSAMDRLIEAGATVDTQDSEGHTALMIACRSGKEELAEYLLAKGANPNKTDPHKRSSLFYAVEATKNEPPEVERARNSLVSLLLFYKAKKDWQDDQGLSASEFALQHGRQDLHDMLTYPSERP